MGPVFGAPRIRLNFNFLGRIDVHHSTVWFHNQQVIRAVHSFLDHS